MSSDDQIIVDIALDGDSIEQSFAKLEKEAKAAEKAMAQAAQASLKKSATTAINSIKSQFDGLSKSIGPSLRAAFTKDISGPLDAIKKSVFNLRNAIVGAVAAFGAFSFIRKATQAAVEQENAINQLNNSLRTAGEFSKEASQGFQDLASQLQKQSRFGDEVILQQAALARNYTRTNEETKKLIKASVDLAEATGVSLDTAVGQLGKTFSGTAGRLSQSIPILKSLTEEQLKAGAAIDIVAARFAGSAQAGVRTFSGSLAQLSNIWGDLLEGIGALITKSPTVIAFFNALSTTLTSFQRGFASGGAEIELFFKNLVINATAAAAAVVDSFAALAQVPKFLEFTWVQVQIAILKGVNFVLSAIQPLAGLLDKILGQAGESADVIIRNFERIAQLEGKLLGIAAGGNTVDKSFNMARKAVDDFATSFQEAMIQGVAQEAPQSPVAPLVEVIDKDLLKLREKVRLLQEETKEVIGNTFFNTDEVLAGTPTVFENVDVKGREALLRLEQQLTATKNKMVQLSQQIGQAVNNGIANTISNSIAGVVNALKTGENAFSAFGKAALATIGDLAVQLGQTLIAAGIGIEALKVLGGAAAIGAGIALVAIGTLIKSFSGGVSVNPSGGSSVTPPLSDLQPGGISSDLIDQGARVEINIQGDVFDSDATGIRLADILKEQGFQNAVLA